MNRLNKIKRSDNYNNMYLKDAGWLAIFAETRQQLK